MELRNRSEPVVDTSIYKWDAPFIYVQDSGNIQLNPGLDQLVTNPYMLISDHKSRT